MNVYVVRHAAAAPRGDYASDAERPLTEKGVADVELVAAALVSAGVELDAVYASPFVRARQTGDIIAAATGCPVSLTDGLASGHSAKEVVAVLADLPGESVAIVGHAPQLDEVVALLVTGKSRAVVDMKKGAVACVEFEGKVRAGKGVLAWHVVPKLVKSLSR
ncbi:MAG: phosphohistidine phosphatase SixA [Planctomycetota bacterium]|jgi:phosphohistidine phosphatase